MMTYFRVTLHDDFNQVSLPNGVMLNGGESTNLTAEDFFRIPEDSVGTLFSTVSEEGGGSSGMNPEDINATAPILWDAETNTISMSPLDVTDLTGMSSVGTSLVTAESQAAARTAIGAGTSNLALGTTASTAKAGNYQPTAANISDASTVGRNVLTAADAAAARTAIGAGTSSLTLGTGASNAAAGNHTHPQYLAATQGAAVADASGDAEAQLNALLASLRTAGIIAS